MLLKASPIGPSESLSLRKDDDTAVAAPMASDVALTPPATTLSTYTLPDAELPSP